MKPSTHTNAFWDQQPLVVVPTRPTLMHIVLNDHGKYPAFAQAIFITHLKKELGDTILEKVKPSFSNGIATITLPQGCENRVYETISAYTRDKQTSQPIINQ